MPARDRSPWQAFRSLDVEVALRAAIAAAVPLAVLLAAGRVEWAAYAAFGAMTAIFGRNEPYRLRLRTVTVAAATLLSSVTAGAALAVTGAPLAVEALVLVAVLAAGLLVVNVARLAPPTPLFFVFALLVCASVPTPHGEFGARIAVAAASAAFAWMLSVSGWWLRRVGAAAGANGSDAGGRVGDRGWFKPLARVAPVDWGAVRRRGVWGNIAQHAVAAVAAGAIAILFGIGHPYWAVVSVVAVIPPAGAAHSVARAWHRVLGTAGGVVIAAVVLWPDPPAWVLVLVIAVAQFGAEVLVGRHYGAALLCITPLALAVAHLSQPVSVGGLLVDRLVETVVGCAVAVVVVLAARFAPTATARLSARAGR